jgi:hypothetical protein
LCSGKGFHSRMAQNVGIDQLPCHLGRNGNFRNSGERGIEFCEGVCAETSISTDWLRAAISQAAAAA